MDRFILSVSEISEIAHHFRILTINYYSLKNKKWCKIKIYFNLSLLVWQQTSIL